MSDVFTCRVVEYEHVCYLEPDVVVWLSTSMGEVVPFPTPEDDLSSVLSKLVADSSTEDMEPDETHDEC